MLQPTPVNPETQMDLQKCIVSQGLERELRLTYAQIHRGIPTETV